MRMNFSIVRPLMPAALLVMAWLPSSGFAAEACPSTLPASSPVNISGTISAVLFDEDCRFVYAANVTKGTVEIVSVQTRQVQDSIAVGAVPVSMDTSPDGKTLYVASSEGHTVSVIDLAQRRVLANVEMPGKDFDYPGPTSVAVAKNGKVLIVSSLNFFELDPVTYQFVPRSDDDGVFSNVAKLKASGDRSVIAVVGLQSGGLTRVIGRYLSASDTLHLGVSPTVYAVLNGLPVLDSIDYFGLNHRGDLGMYSPFVANLTTSTITIRGAIRNGAFGENLGVAVDPYRPVGYQLIRSTTNATIDVLDLASFTRRGPALSVGAPAGDTTVPNAPITRYANLAISRDGVLLAAVTTNGISIVRANPTPATAVRTVVSSSTSTDNMSFLRVYNGSTVSGTVRVKLSDTSNGTQYADWTSPVIPPGAAPQIAISTIESAATQPFSKPTLYLATVESTLQGSVSQVLWSASNGRLSNFSACDDGMSTQTGVLVDVHSSLFDGAYPSSISIFNTGAAPVSPALEVLDALSGKSLGLSTPPVAVASGASRTVRMRDVEAALNLTPAAAGQLHYVVRSASTFTGYIQHTIHNLQAGIVTDMTGVCVLP